MALFQIAYEKTSQYEGEYSNNKSDKGGETYCGISRVNFPYWAGWEIIDQLPGRLSLKSNEVSKLIRQLSNYSVLMKLVYQFYKETFWDAIKGDQINSQVIANNIYDFAVNSGTDRAVRYAQHILSTTEDGQFGNITLGLLNSYNGNFISQYKSARSDFLNRIVAKNPSQNIFLGGWLKRVELC